MPKNKAKGSKAERELLDMFVKNNFRAARVAGSGMMENSDCDLISGKIGAGKYAVEVKSSKKTSKYITKDQINRFLVFSEIFGLTPVIAVRFNRLGWYFFNPSDLVDSGKNWVINLNLAKEKGKRFSQFFFNERENKLEDKKDNNPDISILSEIDIYEEDDE
jgi:Holliday junction resolvase